MTSNPQLEKPATDAGAVARRLGLSGLDYPVPARANRIDFMLGGLTLAALTLLAVTGIVLTQYYNPAPLGAHGSVRYMIMEAPLAALMRDMHVWSASGSLALVFAHLATVFGGEGFVIPVKVCGGAVCCYWLCYLDWVLPVRCCVRTRKP